MAQVQLGYFTFETPDVAKARAFYGALFGWSFDDDSAKPHYAHVTGSEPPFGITKVERPSGHPNLYFRVDDIQAVCARITELGGKAAIPAQSETGWGCTVADDQGVSFSLWQAAEGY